MMKKIITGVLISAMTLSMAGMAFADMQVQPTKTDRSANRPRLTQEQRQDQVKTIFDQVVLKGVITQEQEDLLFANSFMKLSPEERKANVAQRLAESVASGKMTQEQADKILEKMSNNENMFNKGDRSNREGALNKGDRSNREGALNKGDRSNIGNKEEWENLSPEERKVKMEERLAEAVASGKMTQEKANKILERLENGETTAMKKSPVKRLVEKGVNEGVITQEQANEIIKITSENRGK